MWLVIILSSLVIASTIYRNMPRLVTVDSGEDRIRRLGSHRPSSSVIGEYAWKHKYAKREHGCRKVLWQGTLAGSRFLVNNCYIMCNYLDFLVSWNIHSDTRGFAHQWFPEWTHIWCEYFVVERHDVPNLIIAWGQLWQLYLIKDCIQCCCVIETLVRFHVCVFYLLKVHCWCKFHLWAHQIHTTEHQLIWVSIDKHVNPVV